MTLDCFGCTRNDKQKIKTPGLLVECSLIFCEPLFVIHEGFAMKQSGLLLVSLYCSAGGGFTHLNNPPPDAIEAVSGPTEARVSPAIVAEIREVEVGVRVYP